MHLTKLQGKNGSKSCLNTFENICKNVIHRFSCFLLRNFPNSKDPTDVITIKIQIMNFNQAGHGWPLIPIKLETVLKGISHIFPLIPVITWKTKEQKKSLKFQFLSKQAQNITCFTALSKV